MPTRVQLRAITPSDRADWDRLWLGYQRFYQVSIPADVTDITWQRLLDPAEPMRGTLAFRGGEALGLVHCIRHRSTWTIGDYCYLQDLFVDETARSFGIGRALIEHVYASAQADGCSRVHWLTHETNVTAMELYNRVAERSGFVQYRKML